MKSNHSHSTTESFESCRMTLLSLGAFSKNGQNDASIHRTVLARVGVHWRSETDHTVICAKVMVFSGQEHIYPQALERGNYLCDSS